MSEDLQEEVLTIQMEAEEKMEKSLQSIRIEFQSIRTGRANPAILNRIHVEYYGEPTPLQQLASVSVPEPRMLVIQPYDKSALQEIDRAIQKSDLGISPSNDGKVIRLNIPPLTEERRREFVKLAKKIAEDGKVAVRNVRRDAIEHIKKLEKDKHLPQDQSKDHQEEVQKLTDRFIDALDKAAADKEVEIMEH
ncbi:ribosome recycling factor [bacterium (Candidatus Blackallbacteria) CG17_big_fil_post_rev_8_21_14_2_50_48_46]|uniref:Ribosome-recycling factor n=1 Tax=bacterium (Candidatus Blackallbacteria) CG17_big_fil_post_rev_8_21_14_2_50_48_46 TaxID=2014261 RepID=A0A2M7FY28_9BACT|nr:MAG: ribosome recycling factor [bacterium (Candidatus Blackallbacteria) CG18_big_fil_WC_8_21_14_2_50_49_26]PIW14108.1 MAG: ribosome recycling factor [bacterium (Candidatus Blackallbacteria) CG17_big_fil_post_rev_8_21_14_2_50_48_46]PIW45838.1 MAG: ribosome recycling factor [bacterium (Candidatus Blackallbacteria) CG13_big_fil_rev_8_21_14_2_50_49_14]